MASINKVILIGNLGRVSRGSLDAPAREAFDRYGDALSVYDAALRNLHARTFGEAARRLAEANHQLRRLVGSFLVAKEVAAPGVPILNHSAAFFHSAKVDARNLP